MTFKLGGQVLESRIGCGPTAKLVLVGLAEHAWADGQHSFPSRQTLATYAECSLRSVTRALAELQEAGYIEVAARATRYRPTEYRIRVDRLTSLPPRVDTSGSSGWPPVSSEVSTEQELPRVGSSSEEPTLGRGQRSDTEPDHGHDPEHDDETPAASEQALEDAPTPPGDPPPEAAAQAAERGRRRRELKEAFREACQWEPQDMTPSSWGRVERAAKEADEGGWTPRDIRRIADMARERWPGVDVTPQAIVNWMPMAVRWATEGAPERRRWR